MNFKNKFESLCCKIVTKILTRPLFRVSGQRDHDLVNKLADQENKGTLA